MLLSDVAAKGQKLQVDCRDCGAQTVVDPLFFIGRRGDISLDTLRPDLICGGCGASDIELQPVKADAIGHRSTRPADS